MLNSFFNKLKTCPPWTGYIFVFSLSFIIFLYLMIPPLIFCPDGFYHTKMALLIKEQGLIKDFPWLQFTTYKDLFVDHHLFYHFLLIPFISLPTPKNLDYLSQQLDPLIKTKLATAFFASLVFLTLYWFIKKMKIKFPAIWTLLAFFSPPFLMRLSLIRAPSISIIIIILGFYLISNKNYFCFSLLCFIYVWTYGAWPLMIIFVSLYCLAIAIKKIIDYYAKLRTENQKYGLEIKILISRFFITLFSKSNIKLILSCVIGLTLGLVINPYFPKTFSFYWLQTIKIAFANYHDKIGVGIEWYPIEFKDFILSNLPIFFIWIISLSWFVFLIKKQEDVDWFFVLVSCFFFLYTLKAKRNIEYFVPCSILFSALMFKQIKNFFDWQEIKRKLKNCLRGPESVFFFIIGLLFFLCFFSVFGFYLNAGVKNLEKNDEENDASFYRLQRAANWISAHASPKEIVFQSNWAIFPPLFYFNSQNYYINGLDQTFMYEKSSELYKDWLNLVTYRLSPEQTAKIIKEKFQASYVLADKRDKNFIKLLKKSPGLKEVYQDNETIIYQIF